MPEVRPVPPCPPSSRFSYPADFVRDYAVPVFDRHAACPQLLAVWFDGDDRLLGRQTLALGPLATRPIDLKRLWSLARVPAGARFVAFARNVPGVELPDLDAAHRRTLDRLDDLARSSRLGLIDYVLVGDKYLESAAYRREPRCRGWRIHDPGSRS